jgi:hypothetical protein
VAEVISRRAFMALASGLLVPYEPERIYSFLPAWRLLQREFVDRNIAHLSRVVVCASQEPDKLFLGAPWLKPGDKYPGVPDGMPDPRWVADNVLGIIHPSNLLDVQKSCEAFGVEMAFS